MRPWPRPPPTGPTVSPPDAFASARRRRPPQIVIAPRLGRFLSTYPDVVLELVTDERLVDIVAERFDAGIRLGEQVVRDMVAVQVGGRQRLVVVGTPKYFARHGRPRQPKDLLAHRCIAHVRSGGEAYRWELEKAGRERQVAVTGALFENNPHIALRAVLTGEVIGFVFEAQVAPHLAKRTLETVLDDWCPRLPRFSSLLSESPRGHTGAASVHRDNEGRQLAS